ncbi:MAG: hypothetical protein R3A10_13090 [Caldilineaceae bacterium]
MPVLFMQASDGMLFDDRAVATGRRHRETIPAVVATPPPAHASLHTATSDWVTIPAGAFLMSSDKERDGGRVRRRTAPAQRLYVSVCHRPRACVTVAQFERFVQATGYRTTAGPKALPTCTPGASGIL